MRDKPNYCTEPEDWVTKVVATHEDGTYTTERVPLPKREWVGLTKDEIEEIADWSDKNAAPWYLEYARAIEAKLKEKNV